MTMAVAYRTKMTISPTSHQLISSQADHYFKDVSPKHNRYPAKKSEKKVIDIDKPMRCGAFVDISRARQYTEEDFSLPETPPFSWLLRNIREEAANAASSTENLASSPTDENSAGYLNKNSPQLGAGTTNNNNASVKSLEKVASTSPKSAEPGTSPSSFTNEFRRSSSRWSTRTIPSDEEKVKKELHFPFANYHSDSNDIALFYRECFHAPPLQQFEEVLMSSSEDGAAANVERNSSVDDLTLQLEKLESCLDDYDTLVTSLCQDNTETDSNSNS